MPESPTSPPSPPPAPASWWTPRRQTAAAWFFLLLPFFRLLVVTGGNERASWPDLLPREPTVLMQAASLIEDGDLAYSRLDFDRQLLAWHGNPPDLELATGGDGRRVGFQYPSAYAAYLAPFLALSPERGIGFANLALLTLAAVLSARALWSRLGAWGPALILVWLFGSAAFSGIFRADGDVFGLSLVMISASLWLGAEKDKARGGRWRALFTGLLLSPVLLTEPVALLLLPLFAFWRNFEIRRRLIPRFLLGAALGVLALVLVQWWNGGGLHLVATSSFKFTPATGYPEVDFPAADWSSEVPRLAALHWDGAPRASWGLEPRLIAWNFAYFLFGSQLGVFPYLLPLAVALIGLRQKKLLLAFGATMVYLLIFHPFNFWGGPGPIGNRALLPLYGAAILALPSLRGRLDGLGFRSLLALVSAPLVVAAPFLLPMWLKPAAWPFASGSYTHQSLAARILLPHEISQRWLPGGAVEEVGGIFVAALDQQTWVERQNGRLGVDGPLATFLVSSSEPLAALSIELEESGPSEIGLSGATLGERTLRSDGAIVFRAEPHLWRRHALWWSPLPMYIYRLEMELPPDRSGQTHFRLLPEWQPKE